MRTPFKALRRVTAVVAGGVSIALISATAALAFPSGGNPGAPGPNHIEWTGQGGVSASGTGDCTNGTDPLGNNVPFIQWVLTTDGGDIQVDATTPTIVLGGTGSGTFNHDSTPDGRHFITPFFNLTGLTASVQMNVTSAGNGGWNLVISHGCAAPTAAAAPRVSKDAAGAFDTTWNWGIKKTADPKLINAPPGSPAQFNYTVIVTPVQAVNDITVIGTITATNPDSATIDIGPPGNTIDQLSDGVNCHLINPPVNGAGDIVLQPGDNSLPYTCTLPDNTPLSGLTNTVTANWGDQTLGNGAFLKAGSASFTSPVIQFVQGNVSNNCIDVTDSVAGDLGTVCAAGGTHTFTYQVSYNTQANPDPAGTCTKHDNTATFTSTDNPSVTGSDSQEVQVCVGAPLTVKKDATPSFNRKFTWTIAKSVDNSKLVVPAGTSATANYLVTVGHDAGTDSGWQVTGTIHVTNPNDFESVSLLDVTDAINNGGLCKITSGNPSGTIAPGATADLGYQCDYASAPSPSAFTNTATASWDPALAFTASGSADGTATGDFANATPAITDGSVKVNDSLKGDLGTVSYTDLPNPTVFSYPLTFTAPQGVCETHDNLATFTTSNTGTTGSAGQTVTVCGGLDLTVAKTANPSFNRTYLWNIAKAASPTTLIGGGKVTYTITVNQTGVKDGNYQVTGAITVSNPNSFEDIPLSNLIDIPGDNGICQLDNPAQATATVPALGSVTATYTCGYSSAPAPVPAVNTATAIWDSQAAGTADGSAAGIAPFDFSKTPPSNPVNQLIHVTDTMGGALGTVTATDPPAAPATGTFSYSKTFPSPASGCNLINNTATITETGQNASAQVKNCATLGALTMGFWHNKNGQLIISQASQAALQTFLKQYNMFSDAPGSNIAGYFLTVFNAANASGNGAPMLKAQTLATALDVYFSDPSLGGNKIGAGAPIGGVQVDVSPYSAAFGGATHMTVSQMLAFVSTQSNAGGTVFYGGNKTLTSLAISAFDAVNNSTIAEV